jgi:DNA-binding transcriptional regulator YiaG
MGRARVATRAAVRVMTDDPEFVRTARKQLGLTQVAFGERLGISKRTVIRWEMGDVPLKRRDRVAITQLVERPQASKRIT